MNERWQEIERIYHAARERDGSARAEYLAQACGEDTDLRHEVESLLVQADQHAHGAYPDLSGYVDTHAAVG